MRISENYEPPTPRLVHSVDDNPILHARGELYARVCARPHNEPWNVNAKRLPVNSDGKGESAIPMAAQRQSEGRVVGLNFARQRLQRCSSRHAELVWPVGRRHSEITTEASKDEESADSARFARYAKSGGSWTLRLVNLYPRGDRRPRIPSASKFNNRRDRTLRRSDDAGRRILQGLRHPALAPSEIINVEERVHMCVCIMYRENNRHDLLLCNAAASSSLDLFRNFRRNFLEAPRDDTFVRVRVVAYISRCE